MWAVHIALGPILVVSRQSRRRVFVVSIFFTDIKMVYMYVIALPPVAAFGIPVG